MTQAEEGPHRHRSLTRSDQPPRHQIYRLREHIHSQYDIASPSVWYVQQESAKEAGRRWAYGDMVGIQSVSKA